MKRPLTYELNLTHVKELDQLRERYLIIGNRSILDLIQITYVEHREQAIVLGYRLNKTFTDDESTMSTIQFLDCWYRKRPINNSCCRKATYVFCVWTAKRFARFDVKAPNSLPCHRERKEWTNERAHTPLTSVLNGLVDRTNSWTIERDVASRWLHGTPNHWSVVDLLRLPSRVG